MLCCYADEWLPNDINKGHLDNFFFLLAGLMVFNLCIYILVAHFYKYAPAKETSSDRNLIPFERPLPEVKDGEGVIVSEQEHTDLHLQNS